MISDGKCVCSGGVVVFVVLPRNVHVSRAVRLLNNNTQINSHPKSFGPTHSSSSTFAQLRINNILRTDVTAAAADTRNSEAQNKVKRMQLQRIESFARCEQKSTGRCDAVRSSCEIFNCECVCVFQLQPIIPIKRGRLRHLGTYLWPYIAGFVV